MANYPEYIEIKLKKLYTHIIRDRVKMLLYLMCIYKINKDNDKK